MAEMIGNAPEANTQPVLTEKDVPAGLSSKLSAAFDAPDTEPDKIEQSVEVGGGTDQPAKVLEEPSVPSTDSESVADSTEESDSAENNPTPNSPKLPAAFRRTLKAYEYTDEEIEEGLKAQGEKFVAVAARLHSARSKEIARYAEAGRQAKVAKQSPTPVKPEADDLAPVDVAALKKIYGPDQPLIDQLVTPLNKALAEIKNSRATIRKYEEQQKTATQTAFANQVNGFFSGSELKDFADHYGTAPETLTQEQLTRRTTVLRMADELLTGASIQGRRMPLDEALQLAHDATSGETKEKKVRQTIASQLTKREQGMTLKPASRMTSNKTPPTTKMRENVKAGMKKAFN